MSFSTAATASVKCDAKLSPITAFGPGSVFAYGRRIYENQQ